MTSDELDLRCACSTARQLARVLTQLYDGRLKESGIEAPQFALLITLEMGGPLTQVELGRRFAMDKTTVSRNLKVLEKNGWIEPTPGVDRRQRLFKLTSLGRERLEEAKPQWKKAQERLRAGMSAEQWSEMFRVFRTVAEVAQKEMKS